MLEQLAQIYRQYGYEKIAVGVDTRTSPLLDQLPKSLKVLKNNGVDLRVIFLDANNNCLVMRYSETRRKHPLAAPERTIEDCINIERDLLADISQIAHRIDTSNLSANALRKFIKEFVDADFNQLNIIVQSLALSMDYPLIQTLSLMCVACLIHIMIKLSVILTVLKLRLLNFCVKNLRYKIC